MYIVICLVSVILVLCWGSCFYSCLGGCVCLLICDLLCSWVMYFLGIVVIQRFCVLFGYLFCGVGCVNTFGVLGLRLLRVMVFVIVDWFVLGVSNLVLHFIAGLVYYLVCLFDLILAMWACYCLPIGCWFEAFVSLVLGVVFGLHFLVLLHWLFC